MFAKLSPNKQLQPNSYPVLNTTNKVEIFQSHQTFKKDDIHSFDKQSKHQTTWPALPCLALSRLTLTDKSSHLNKCLWRVWTATLDSIAAEEETVRFCWKINRLFRIKKFFFGKLIWLFVWMQINRLIACLGNKVKCVTLAVSFLKRPPFTPSELAGWVE